MCGVVTDDKYSFAFVIGSRLEAVPFSSRTGEDDIFDDTTSTVCDVKFGLDISRYHDPHANGDFNTIKQLSSLAVLVAFPLVSIARRSSRERGDPFISNTDEQSKSMMRTMFARSGAVPL
jgi:hypothetical protein